MRRKLKYKITALFFLLVFSLNTIAGFACSVGIDLGYNSRHHHDEEKTVQVVHTHKDGKKHIHKEKKGGQDHSSSQRHDQKNDQSNNDKDNCCNDKVIQIEQIDKSVPPSLNIMHPIFLIAFVDAFYNVPLPFFDVVKNIKQFARSYHPPISNIRIAIQSFQI